MKRFNHNNSAESYELIHFHLSQWVKYALENGFEEEPLANNYVRELITMVDIMMELEQKMEVLNEGRSIA